MNFTHLLKRSVLLFLIALMAFSGCSTKKDTWNRRAFHNLTSHYNVYWNGNESLKAGAADLREQAADDYMRVLRVYNYGSRSDAQRQYPAMDRAIEKASIGVQKHSMVFGGREKVRWIDDSYLLMAKAHFYKQDYISARRTFDFVARQYHYNDISYTAELWLARTFIEMKQFDRALATLTALQGKLSSPEIPNYVEENFDAVFAEYFIMTENYSRAIPYLERAVKANKDRQRVTRMMFILGQLHESESNYSQSLKFYRQVIRRNPEYDMAFQARINLAKAYDPAVTDSRDIIRVLEKMLGDDRNKDYQDKIYYALAEVAFKDEEMALGMEYLRKSVAVSVRDNMQKAASALQLADLYFDQTKYEPAQAYYDTAVQVLPEEYPGFDSIKGRAAVLTDLVVNLQTIQLQDSLLMLAAMDSVQLFARIDGMIRDYIAEEQRKQEEQRSQDMLALTQGMFGRTDPTGTAPSSGEWYFYNPNTLSHGFTEFLRKWGRRELEDNWRISDRQSISMGGDDLFADQSEVFDDQLADTMQYSVDPRDRSYYLQDIPRTPERQQQARESIMEAYNNAAYLYKESLNDYPRAKEAYLSLNNRFPENPYEVQAWYNLYRMFADEGNHAEADHYKALIVNNYPDTDYANILNDPDFYKKQAEARNESLVFYASTYDAYLDGQYYRVLMNANRARAQYASDSLVMPKFEFLRAVAMGRVESLDSLATGLSSLVDRYPKDEVAILATSILRQLRQEYSMEVGGLDDETPGEAEIKSPYTYTPGSMHMVMIITNTANVRTDPLRVRISDFNGRYFSGSKLSIRSIMLDNQLSLITVGNFEQEAKAVDYWEVVSANDYVFGGIEKGDYHVYPVSASNYPIFYREKNIDQYHAFWEKHYKENK